MASTRPDAEPPATPPARLAPASSDRLTLAALLAWCSAIGVIDAWVVDNAVLLGLLITGPLLAAWRASSRTTSIVAGYAVLLGLVLGFPDDMFLSLDHVVRVGIVTLGSVLAVMLARTRERLERAQFRHSLVADAGDVLGSALDYEVTLIGLARLCASRLADWCFVFVKGDDGSVRQVAAAHADAARQRQAWELLFRYPLDPSRSEGPAKVIRSGRSDLQPEVSDALLEVIAADEKNMRLLRRLGLRSAMIVPLNVREQTLGAIAFASAESGRVYGPEDLALAEELGARAAVAVDNARLFRERSRIARTLQESLLPPMLPDLPGLDLAARFQAAGAGLEVGGDFYDLFETGDSSWAVAIGDVCGKGSEAAAITALARYTVRAAAMRQEDPSQILGLLNEALLRQRTDKRFCTVLYGRLETNGSGHWFEFASGGHPLPLVLRAGASGGEVGAPGTLLGIVPDPDLRDERVLLCPGDAVVLYTDGVTDSAAPLRILSSGELAAAVGPPVGLDADTIAERVMRTALSAAGNEPRDDIAILVLKVPDAE